MRRDFTPSVMHWMRQPWDGDLRTEYGFNRDNTECLDRPRICPAGSARNTDGRVSFTITNYFAVSA